MSNIIWGLLLILIGTEILIKSVFGIDTPFIKIAFGIFLVYLGISFITDIGKNTKQKTFKFSDKYIIEKNIECDYRTLFGDSTIDLSHSNLTTHKKISIDTLFGSTTVIINPDIPTKIIVDSRFANAHLPNSSTITFGKYTYTNGNCNEKAHLEIHAKVIFGNLSIKNS